MADTLRQALTNEAINNAIETISDHLALPLSNGVHRDIHKAFATLQALQNGLAAGDVFIDIPAKKYKPKRELNKDTPCNFPEKKGECGKPSLLGKHHCYRHRPGGPVDLARLAALQALPLLHNGPTLDELPVMPGENNGLGLVPVTTIDAPHFAPSDETLSVHPNTIMGPTRQFFRATESQSSGSESPNPSSVEADKSPRVHQKCRPNKAIQL